RGLFPRLGRPELCPGPAHAAGGTARRRGRYAPVGRCHRKRPLRQRVRPPRQGSQGARDTFECNRTPRPQAISRRPPDATPGKDAALFVSRRDTAMPVRTIQAVIASLARRARLKRVAVSAHTLRHTFALGYLHDNPGKLVELASLLGHDSLDTTAVYTRPSRDDLAADLERSHLNVDG